MKLTVSGHETFCYTGGKPYDGTKPTVVFIHGVLNDHSVWTLQTRYFAHHGWNVLAPDLPGHCRSAGDPPRTVEQAAAFVIALLDAADDRASDSDRARNGGLADARAESDLAEVLAAANAGSPELAVALVDGRAADGDRG